MGVYEEWWKSVFRRKSLIWSCDFPGLAYFLLIHVCLHGTILMIFLFHFQIVMHFKLIWILSTWTRRRPLGVMGRLLMGPLRDLHPLDPWDNLWANQWANPWASHVQWAQAWWCLLLQCRTDLVAQASLQDLWVLQVSFARNFWS